jgi:uncharacterized BrkB/YihY/UPF0761 family membrane protein
MLETISDLVNAVVELVARGVFALLRLMFRWEPSRERPAWVRALAIVVILAFAGTILSVAFAFFVTAFYVLLAIAAIGAVLAFLG